MDVIKLVALDHILDAMKRVRGYVYKAISHLLR